MVYIYGVSAESEGPIKANHIHIFIKGKIYAYKDALYFASVVLLASSWSVWWITNNIYIYTITSLSLIYIRLLMMW